VVVDVRTRAALARAPPAAPPTPFLRPPAPPPPRPQRDPHGSGFDPASLGLPADFRLTNFSKLKG